MLIKRNGIVMISTLIILSLISSIGILLFKMSKNNNELSYIYNFQGDIYDLDENEEKDLERFMEELNNINNEENSVFEESFDKDISNSSLKYEKEDNKLTLKVKKEDKKYRERKIIYKFENEKIILIPTYEFIDK